MNRRRPKPSQYGNASRRAHQMLVVLNGPAGVGKTTVGRTLAATSPDGVCIHGDALKHFVVRREGRHVMRGLAFRGAAALAELYLKAGYELIVVDFVFEKAAHLHAFTSRIRLRVPVRVFLLWAPLNVVQRRERGRVGRKRLGPRVSECWRAMQANLEELGEPIDASGRVAHIVTSIRRRLGSER